MKLTVVYPCYFPDVRVLSRIAAADIVVWADNFIYKKHACNRMRIKTVAGPQWLTIPVLTTGGRRQIRRTVIDEQHHWRHKHLKSLQVSYQNSPYYFFLAEEIRHVIEAQSKRLNDVISASALFLLKKTRLGADFVFGSALPDVADRSQRVVAWLKECCCDEYLVDSKDAAHIDVESITREGLTVSEFDYNLQTYHQLYGGFIDNVSGLDLLFNEGEASRSILMRSAKTKERRGRK